MRTRLVVSAVALIAVVGIAIGTVTTLALRSYLVHQLDDQLVTAVDMAARAPRALGNGPEPLGAVLAPGTPLGTVGIRLDGSGEVVDGVRSVAAARLGGHRTPLTPAQNQALAAVAERALGQVVDADLPGLGAYRVLTGPDGRSVVGFPTREVSETVNTLILVEACVTAAGLIAAGLAGQALVGVALRPLRRVAATATRVSELRLHSGEVALRERVPVAEADPRTEIGQVGAALNRMLGHVGSALAARQESETRVRQFVADASHELRTPLASIRGYAELTRRGREETGPDTRHALSRIESEAARMTGLVEDLLLLARLDAGRPLSYEPTDLVPLVVDAVSDARAAGQDHQWRLELPATPETVQADPARLHQVLVNLLANARTHTPAGTTVTARVSRETSADRIRLEIEDDGPGIPAALLPRVFERFARGDASRSRNAGSTGLGLAIVHAVVGAHGGRVSVRSTPGNTCFEVSLPASHPAADLPADPTPSLPADLTPSLPANRPANRPAPVSGEVPAAGSQDGHRRTTQV
ncbi:HAMP domain-containing histidine kinase [Streptomyces sp. NBC_00239]|nr:HAMP domain-containing sensor histidine kinase [Streptomyces sp. NBC_00239]